MKQRFLALLIIADGGSIAFTVNVMGISESTLNSWFKNYLNDGIDSLNSFQYKAKSTFLTQVEKEQLVDWVKKMLPCNREIIQ